MRCTHPQLNRCPDNTKRACHRRARSKMEWIYTQTKVSGHGSLELAQENRKKEERLRKWLFYEHQTDSDSGIYTGADPENLYGRWLMGWLPIVNYTGATGVAG